MRVIEAFDAERCVFTTLTVLSATHMYIQDEAGRNKRLDIHIRAQHLTPCLLQQTTEWIRCSARLNATTQSVYRA